MGDIAVEDPEVLKVIVHKTLTVKDSLIEGSVARQC